MQQKPKDYDLSKAYDEQGFLEELKEDNDRSTAITAAAFLEFHLAELIKAFLIADADTIQEVERASFNDFDKKIALAYSLGLINREEHDEIERIKNIRNEFAHRLHGLNFEHTIIRSKSGVLNLLSSRGTDIADHRKRYLLTVFALYKQISKFRLAQAQNNRRTPPKEYDFQL